MIWLLPNPSPLFRQQVSLSRSSCASPVELIDGRGEGGEGGGAGAKSYENEKASINTLSRLSTIAATPIKIKNKFFMVTTTQLDSCVWIGRYGEEKNKFMGIFFIHYRLGGVDGPISICLIKLGKKGSGTSLTSPPVKAYLENTAARDNIKNK